MRLFFLFTLLSLFLLSCENNRTGTTVYSGQTGSLIFSKACSGGSIQVYRQSNRVVTPGVAQLDSSVGSSVLVKGAINSSSCHSGGQVSFSCEGSVVIDTNRGIRCNTGTVSSGYSNFYNNHVSNGLGSSLVPNLFNQSSQNVINRFNNNNNYNNNNNNYNNRYNNNNSYNNNNYNNNNSYNNNYNNNNSYNNGYNNNNYNNNYNNNNYNNRYNNNYNSGSSQINNAVIGVYDNGTKVFVEINSSHPVNGGQCPIGFSC